MRDLQKTELPESELDESPKASPFWSEPQGLRIAHRQAATFCLIGFLLVGALSAILFRSIRATLLTEHQGQVELSIRSFEDELWRDIARKDGGTVQDLLNAIVEQGNVDYAIAYDASGQVLAHTFEPFLPEGFELMTTPGWSNAQLRDWSSGELAPMADWSNSRGTGALRTGFAQSRISAAALSTLAPLVLLALALVPLGALAMFVISRKLSRDAESIVVAAQALAEGKSFDRPKTSTPELALLNDSLVGAFASASRASQAAPAPVEAQPQQDDSELQDNINAFLGIATDVAMGDLTKRGQVTADVLGNVVDAFNVVIERMDATLIDVRNAVEEVSGGSDRVIGASDRAQGAARDQLDLVNVAQTEVAEATALATAISDQAKDSSASATYTSEAAEQGRLAVLQAREEMQKVRDQVSAVSRRIKTLGDRSLEVSEIAETISSISYQTNLLAVNAAIEASGAGEAGQRFSVVAEEVRRLAEDTSRAARKIDDLVSDFQPEVQAAVTAMDQSSREVEDGFAATERAESSLGEIEAFSRRADEAAREIVGQAAKQTSGMGSVSNAVESIASQSQATLSMVSEGHDVAANLYARANSLLGQLLQFKISEQTMSAAALPETVGALPASFGVGGGRSSEKEQPTSSSDEDTTGTHHIGDHVAALSSPIQESDDEDASPIPPAPSRSAADEDPFNVLFEGSTEPDTLSKAVPSEKPTSTEVLPVDDEPGQLEAIGAE